MKGQIGFCIAAVAIGFFVLGRVTVEPKVVERIVKKEVKVYNLSDVSKEDLEIAASFLNPSLVLVDEEMYKQRFEDAHQRNKKILEARK